MDLQKHTKRVFILAFGIITAAAVGIVIAVVGIFLLIPFIVNLLT